MKKILSLGKTCDPTLNLRRNLQSDSGVQSTVVITVKQDPYLAPSFSTAQSVQEIVKKENFTAQITQAVSTVPIKEAAATTFLVNPTQAIDPIKPEFALTTLFDSEFVGDKYSFILFVSNTDAKVYAGIMSLSSKKVIPKNVDEMMVNCDQFKISIALQNEPTNITFSGLSPNQKFRLFFQAESLGSKTLSDFYSSIEPKDFRSTFIQKASHYAIELYSLGIFHLILICLTILV